MKLSIPTIALLILLTACKNNKENEVKNLPKESIEIVPEIDAESHTAESYILTLQGTWKRTTYPYGTIEVEDTKIKISPGEGAVKPAEFEPFSFSKICPFTNNTSKDLQQNYIVLEDKKICSPFVIKADTLFMVYANNKPGIPYTRITK